MASIKGISEKTLLVILDGFGINDKSEKNAVRDAKKPNLDKLFQDYPYTLIQAGGESVGLPNGVMGNSEVGHMNIGAGRPIRQDLVRINEAIDKNTLKDMPKLLELIETAKKLSKRIHLMGLLSDGGVHSHIDHLLALLKIFKEHSDLKIFFHAFMDGRDTQKTNGIKYAKTIQESGLCTFASMQGRSIGMDRDRRWEKIEAAYSMMTGNGTITDISPIDYIQSEYDKDIYDEFITPVLFDAKSAIEKDDCVFFINFRPDRAKQISYAFTDPSFKEFATPVRPSYYLCMTPYIDEEVELPILFDKEKIKGTLCEYLSNLGHRQFKIAETEKYAHVTYFFNGGETKPFKGEEQKLIPSPKDVATYDLKPEMSAAEVTHELLVALEQDYKFLCVNFANCDMVGHTGNYEAAVKAVETVDKSVGQLMDKCKELGITMLLSADHGNSDEMTHADGSPHTAHSKAPVPFACFHKNLENTEFELNGANFALKDIAPTILYTLNIDRPEAFTGNNIFK